MSNNGTILLCHNYSIAHKPSKDECFLQDLGVAQGYQRLSSNYQWTTSHCVELHFLLSMGLISQSYQGVGTNQITNSTNGYLVTDGTVPTKNCVPT